MTDIADKASNSNTTAEDDSAYVVRNAEGKARFLLVCDHASKRVPQEMDRLGLEPSCLEWHIAYDIGARNITEYLCEAFDAPAIFGNISRLVIDLNRPMDHPGSIPEISDHVSIPGNQNLTEAECEARRERYFRPYHEQLKSMLQGWFEAGDVPALISIHTFTPVMDGFERPWHIGLMWEGDGRIAQPLLENLRQREDLCIGDNLPYSASEPPGYTCETYGQMGGLPHIGIEVRQDLVDTLQGAREWAQILEEALRPILADDSLYEIRRS